MRSPPGRDGACQALVHRQARRERIPAGPVRHRDRHPAPGLPRLAQHGRLADDRDPVAVDLDARLDPARGGIRLRDQREPADRGAGTSDTS